MADVIERFRVLEASGGAGSSPAEAVNATTDPTGLLGLIGFSFKDSAGKVILPQLDSAGRLPVVTEGSGTSLRSIGDVAAGSATLTTVVDLTLSLTEVYADICVQGSCLHSALFAVYYVDDASGTPAETLLGEFIVGPGHFSYEYSCEAWELDTTGGTGVQKLVVKGKNFGVLSALRAAVCCYEKP